MKIKRKIMVAGAVLKVKVPTKNVKTGQIEEVWNRVPRLFGSRAQASVFARQYFAGRKFHTETVRLDVTPLVHTKESAK